MDEAKDKPLIKVKVEGERDSNSKITAEVKDLFSDPIIKVYNKVTKKTQEIPLEFAIELNPDLFGQVNGEIRNELSKKRRKLYNPKNLMTGLLYGSKYYPAVEKPEPRGFGRIGSPWLSLNLNAPETIILEKDADHKKNQKYIPYLTWRDEDPDEGIADGWDLYLSGFDDAPISSAHWNDEGEIRKLANSMLEVEDLKTMLALLRPEESIIISSLAASDAIFAKCQRLDSEKDREEIGTFLANSAKLSYSSNEYEKDWIQIDGLVLDSYQIAYGINIPHSPKFRLPPEPDSFTARYKIHKAIKAEKEKTRFLTDEEHKIIDTLILDQWVNAVAIEAIKNGWRVIDPWGTSDPSGYNPWLWLTKLSKEEWATIAPAIERAEVDSRRPTPNW